MADAAFVEQIVQNDLLAALRQADPAMVEALLDPACFRKDGKLDRQALAQRTGRTLRDAIGDLDRLRKVATR